ncbi:MAG: 16S rRNA (adenine(1518)-N(6)/adenine(1519)-N(6))-dimethyltransferase RsmA [Planctomycetota bacterium]
MSESRAPWRQLKSELDAIGFRPSKRLGQNFLLDEGACAGIARIADTREGETVLEVGVGLGFLTWHLLERGAQVIGIEIDRRLASVARRHLGEPEALELVEVDVLAGKHALAPELLERLPDHGDWSLVSNLPYAVGSPVLVLLSRTPHPPRAMTVLVQLEVAERLCAGPGDSDWGPLTARLAPLYEARFVRRVGPAAFRPRPKVDSAVVRLERREVALEPERLERYDTLVGALFTERRKRVRSPLASVVGGLEAADGLLARLGLDPTTRVDRLEPEAMLRLADCLVEPGAAEG